VTGPPGLPPDRERCLRAYVEGRRLRDLALVGSGFEFAVYRATDPAQGPLALRVARRRTFENANDPYVDSRALLRQEHAIASALADRGFPVARPYDLVLGDVDILVSELVESDGSGFSSHEVGRWLATLHSHPPPPWLPVANGELAANEQVRQRMARRWGELRRRVPDLPDPPADSLLGALLAGSEARRLLHLDVRAANLARRGGRVTAFLDWSNSLVGPPALELARAAEFARLPENELDEDELRRGYAEVAPLPGDRGADLVFRLDAAVMLGLVFTSEAPAAARGVAAVERVRELLDRLLRLEPRPSL